MDLRASLHNYLLSYLKKIRDPSTKRIDDFISLLTLINQIIEQNFHDNAILTNYSPQTIKFEFTSNFFSKIIYEVIINFNHPDLFESTKNIEFKSLFLSIISKTNFEDSFLTMLEIILQLK